MILSSDNKRRDAVTMILKKRSGSDHDSLKQHNSEKMESLPVFETASSDILTAVENKDPNALTAALTNLIKKVMDSAE